MVSGTAAVEAFVAAINSKDIDSVMEFFAPDAVYHNMPMPMATVSGSEAIRQVIERFIGPAEEVDWQILTTAETGNSVRAERLDLFVLDGKNVIGGAVNVVTSKPGDEFEVRGEGRAGNFHRIDLRGMATGPLSDTISAKVAFSSRDRDGHTISLQTGNKMMDENTSSARGQLLFKFGDAAEFLLSADYTRDRLAEASTIREIRWLMSMASRSAICGASTARWNGTPAWAI